MTGVTDAAGPHPADAGSVGAVMSQPVLAVTVDRTLQDALAALVNTGLRHLAVVDSAGRCRGVLADRAIAAVWVRDPGALARLRVAELVGGHPPAVLPGASVAAVARVMVRSGVDAVPVVDPVGHLLGIVTTTDVVRALAGLAPEEPADVAGHEASGDAAGRASPQDRDAPGEAAGDTPGAGMTGSDTPGERPW